jgi:hypothetical protein
MNIRFDFGGNSFLIGIILWMVIVDVINPFWLVLAFMLLFDADIKGMPFAKLTYESGVGFKFTKGINK